MQQPGFALLGMPVAASSPVHAAVMPGMSATTRSAQADSATMRVAVPFALNAGGNGRTIGPL
jgi:hypothetical protein